MLYNYPRTKSQLKRKMFQNNDSQVGLYILVRVYSSAIRTLMLLSKIEYGLFFVKSLRFAETHPAEEIIKSRVNEKKPGGIASAEKSQ